MPAARYHVDWSDNAFPAIVRTEADAPDYFDRLSYAAAKAEIMAALQSRVDHARDYMAEVRTWRAADLNPEER